MTATTERMPEIPLEEKRAIERAKQARKLRWMGMDSERDILRDALRDLRSGSASHPD